MTRKMLRVSEGEREGRKTDEEEENRKEGVGVSESRIHNKNR